MKNIYPRARRSQIIVQEMQNEVMVVDTAADQANLLNQTAALVWQECDGQTPVAEIAARVAAKLGAPVDEKIVWYALNQLSSKNLLQERVTAPAHARTLTRREFIRAGLVGAAVVLPVIVTLTVPQPTEASSCLPSGLPCATNGECCSGQCNTMVCA
jgi:hypothetical protein